MAASHSFHLPSSLNLLPSTPFVLSSLCILAQRPCSCSSPAETFTFSTIHKVIPPPNKGHLGCGQCIRSFGNRGTNQFSSGRQIKLAVLVLPSSLCKPRFSWTPHFMRLNLSTVSIPGCSAYCMDSLLDAQKEA